MQATIAVKENFDTAVKQLSECLLEYVNKTPSKFSFFVFNETIPDVPPSTIYASFQIVIRGEKLGFINTFPGEENDSRIYIDLHDPIIAPEEKYTGNVARVMFLEIRDISNRQEVDGFPRYLIHSYKEHNGIVDYLIVINNEEFLQVKGIIRGLITHICQHFGYARSYIASEPWLVIPNDVDREIVRLLWKGLPDKEIALTVSKTIKELAPQTVSNRISELRAVFSTNIVPEREQLKKGFTPIF